MGCAGAFAVVGIAECEHFNLSFSYLGLSVNSLNCVKKKTSSIIIIALQRVQFYFFISEQRVLCITSNTSYVLNKFSFVEFSELSEFSQNI